MKKKLWILIVLSFGILNLACNQGDPEPTVGDAEITKSIPETQEVPLAGKARAGAPGNAGSHNPKGASSTTPPP